MQDKYPQYLKLQAPCGSYNLVITVNLSTNTNSKMHPASSASNFKWELKNTLSFWYFCQCNLNPLTDLQGGKKVIIKKKHPDLPYNYYTTEGGGGNTTNNSPALSKAGKETHITYWSKECTWKLQNYLPMFGFLVLSECGDWFNISSGHRWAVWAGEAGHPRSISAPAISAGLESFVGTLGWFWLQ